MYHHSDKVANLDRMRSLASYDLFHPTLAAELTAICRRSARQLDMPVAAVQAVLDTATATLASTDATLTALGGAPNEISFCPQVVITSASLVVDDLTQHRDYRDNPAVRAGLVRAYAGMPLHLPDGQVLGSHCVFSPQPHHFTVDELAVLAANSSDVVAAITRHERTPASH
jgi:GAF domain-containing protein